MENKELMENLRIVPNFPIKGIQFYDVTTLFKNPACLKELEERLYNLYKDKGITKVVGIESRGFVMGSILASRLGAGLVLARKPGKLPADVIEESYGKEYGVDRIQIHKDAISKDDVILIHDDLIATGGSLNAVYNLVQKFEPKQTYVNVLFEMVDLKGRRLFDENIELTALMDLYGE
ncbi:MAG: adenine phosphoribosyltransferase [Bacteroidaceae bacterium]|nr:adenine phosphoribosyltransferase [Bacteroidaceae bacterium]